MRNQNMAVTGHESSDDLRLQLARKLYTAVVLNASILKVKDVLKILDIERIVNVLKKRSLWNGIRGFLQNYPCSFLVTEENGCAVIKPIVTIEFCRDFDGKRGCQRSYCYKLHVCRHFVKGKCTFGPRCKKPHHFQSETTREVLTKHFLDGLTDEDTREFLCRNVQHFLDPEIANAELPKCLEICKYYNVATGCTRDFCPYIHVCRFFAEDGNCKFGSQCIRKHDINNVHSKILLHRYHMDHLNEPQVLAYLKIKGENRDHQQQQQQQLPPNGLPIDALKENQNQGLSSSNSSLNGINAASQFGTHFSLPNSIYGSLHSLMNEHTNSSRKLSQPSSTGMNGFSSVLDSMSQPRKNSLSSSSLGRSNVYRPSMSMEENNNMLMQNNGDNAIRIGSNGFKASSWSADVDVDFSSTTSSLIPNHNSFVNSSAASSFLSEGSSLANSMRYLNNENTILNNNNSSSHSTSHQITNGSNNFTSKPAPTQPINSGGKISKSFNDSVVTSHLTREFNGFNLHENNVSNNHAAVPRDIINNGQPTRFSSSLGLHNLSLPNVHNASIHQQPNSNSHHHHIHHGNQHQQQHRFQLGDNFDNYNSDPEEKALSTNATSSLRPSSQTGSLFTSNRNPILRTSSNDIISPTGSSSSINGTTSTTTNNSSRSPVFDINDPFSEWNENGERMLRSFSGKENEDDEFSLSYYRTRSLPNFETTSLYNNNNNNNEKKPESVENGGKPHEKQPSTIATTNECSCMKSDICLSNLNEGCKMVNCQKQHSTEPFLWQIATVPATKTTTPNTITNKKNVKNESSLDSSNLAWINVDENENIKLELAYCSVELEQCEIDVFGDGILVNFEEMTGEGRFDVTENINNNNNNNSQFLSALLLQASDEVPSRRNSQETVFYHIRRLTTPSAVSTALSEKHATQWRWYWQDSFGMWRNFPQNSADVIETSAACLSDDIEAKFLAGLDQCLFDEQKVLFDFKALVQMNCQSGKQKKVRRRPTFVSKEQRRQFPSPTGSLTDLSTEVARPGYWDASKNGKTQNSSYQLVNVDEASEMLSNVRNLFSRSMIGKTYEIISVKSVQNQLLWTKFVRLRSQLKSNGFKLAEKFVFKRASEKELAGICQQGFPICTCKQGDKYMSQNTFSTDAKCLLSDNDETHGEIQYMFCVRMAVLLSDLKNKSHSSSLLGEKVEEEDESSSSDDDSNWVPSPTLPNKNSNLLCRHGNQIYPEFLIVLRM